ncbi:MAG: hypothetical protein R3F37_05015 [Candidatus Competibacteraceae bacterium]
MLKALRVASVFLIVIGVIFGYFWTVFSAHVEKMLAALEPDIRIEYAYLRVAPFVGVSIHDVEIRSPHFADTVQIDAVELDALNTFGLFNIARSLSQDALPKSLRLRLQHLSFDLYGDAFRQRRDLFSTYQSLGCDDVAAWNLDMLRGMGYRKIRVDGTVDYNFNEFTHRLDADARLHAHQIAALHVNATFAVPRPSPLFAQLPALSLIALKQTPPQLVSAKASLQDDSFNPRKNRLCAQKRGDSIDGFIAQHIGQAVQTMQTRGMTFGADVVAAYQKFITDGGQVTVSALPENPLDLTALSSLPLEVRLKTINLAAQVNGEPVANLAVTFHEPVIPEPPVVEPVAPDADLAGQPSTTASSDTPSAAPATPPTASASPSATRRANPQRSLSSLPTVKLSPESENEPGFIRWLTVRTPQNQPLRISATELSEYVDQKAIVTLADGRAHKGKLAAVTKSTLQLGLEIPGGTVGFTIQLDEIDEIRLIP